MNRHRFFLLAMQPMKRIPVLDAFSLATFLKQATP
jgi:hypothetical protein